MDAAQRDVLYRAHLVLLQRTAEALEAGAPAGALLAALQRVRALALEQGVLKATSVALADLILLMVGVGARSSDQRIAVGLVRAVLDAGGRRAPPPAAMYAVLQLATLGATAEAKEGAAELLLALNSARSQEERGAEEQLPSTHAAGIGGASMALEVSEGLLSRRAPDGASTSGRSCDAGLLGRMSRHMGSAGRGQAAVRPKSQASILGTRVIARGERESSRLTSATHMSVVRWAAIDRSLCT